MRRTIWMAWAAWAAVLGGCASGPFVDNPIFVRADPDVHVENPVYLPLGVTSNGYSMVFEKVLDIMSEYFEISYANRYDGHIDTFPRVSPGLEQLWKAGSPDFYQRLEASLQTIRRRGSVIIQPAKDGGYFVHITIYKELEDLPRPTRQTAGSASFHSDPTVERQFEVIDPTIFEAQWIPIGRDPELEQVILQRLRKCM